MALLRGPGAGAPKGWKGGVDLVPAVNATPSTLQPQWRACGNYSSQESQCGKLWAGSARQQRARALVGGCSN